MGENQQALLAVLLQAFWDQMFARRDHGFFRADVETHLLTAPMAEMIKLNYRRLENEIGELELTDLRRELNRLARSRRSACDGAGPPQMSLGHRS